MTSYRKTPDPVVPPAKERLTGRGEATENRFVGAPTEEKLSDGQFADHWILTAEERAKGFVRPVRRSYVHVGPEGPRYPTAPLTAEQAERLKGANYVVFEKYPDDSPTFGRYWKQKDLDEVGNGCGAATTMPLAIAETYARDPHFYGSTFCARCGAYFPVGVNGAFVWDDGTRVGT